jgi:hypothetical protein
VSQLLAKAYREWPAADLEAIRAEELDLIDAAIRSLLRLARNQSRPRYSIDAWTEIRGWAERKARLLGLDAPTRHRVQVITEDDVDAEIQRLRDKHAELEEAGLPPGRVVAGELAELGAERWLAQRPAARHVRVQFAV